MEKFMNNPRLEFYETDVTFGPRLKVICDAHDLPFKDGTLDGVVVQAVLEHVADPARAVEEARRVLRPGGLVYAETPFLQPAHATPYDFQRYTFVGHRRIFRQFDEIEFGAVGGPAQALAQCYQHCLLSVSSNRAIRAALYLFGRWSAFWLKYLDYYFLRQKHAVHAASGLYFMGSKGERTWSDSEIIERFRGV
jgi:SAM-dependent methyltransferase